MKQQSMITGQKVKPEKVKFSKRLRAKMTKAEALLWEKLRKSQLEGIHFRRQQILFGFIADFYSHSKRLVIEVDGEIHKKQIQKDKERQLVFEQNGLRVIRFTNQEVEFEIEKVIQAIKDTIKSPAL